MIDRQYTIKGQLAFLNEHDKANRANKYGGAALKENMTNMVAWQLKNDPPIKQSCRIKFIWYISSNHDPDNIRFAAKYVLDGMIKAHVLANDNQAWVHGFDGDDFIHVKKGEEKVILEVRYVTENESDHA